MTYHPEQQVGPGTDEVAEPQPTLSCPGQRDEVLDYGVHTAEGLLHLRQPRGAEVGQCDFAGVSREQHDAEVMLELLDRGRQRWLGDEQPLGGPPVVELCAEHDEVPQLPQRDAVVLARDSSCTIEPAYGSRGRPSRRSAMMFSWTSVVPP